MRPLPARASPMVTTGEFPASKYRVSPILISPRHCPEGVAEPTTTPAASSANATASVTATAAASESAPAEQTANAAPLVGGNSHGVVAVVLGAAAYLL